MIRKVRHREKTLKMIEYINAVKSRRISYSQIAEDLGITKQRVHQLHKNYRTGYPKETKEYLSMLRSQPCEMCGEINKIEVHHIDKNREHNGAYNLMTLCFNCHRFIHKNKQV